MSSPEHIWFVRRVLQNVLRRHGPSWLVVGPTWSSPSGRSGWPALACDRCRPGPWSGPTDPTMLLSHTVNHTRRLSSKLDAITDAANPFIRCLNLQFNGITLKSRWSKNNQHHFREVVTVYMYVSLARGVSAVIRSVSAPPVIRIDVVCPDPRPVLLLRPSASWVLHSVSLGCGCARCAADCPRHAALRGTIPWLECCAA